MLQSSVLFVISPAATHPGKPLYLFSESICCERGEAFGRLLLDEKFWMGSIQLDELLFSLLYAPSSDIYTWAMACLVTRWLCPGS